MASSPPRRRPSRNRRLRRRRSHRWHHARDLYAKKGYVPGEQRVARKLARHAVIDLAVATIVLPLRAMHNRLEAEKRRLLARSQVRLQQVLAHVDAAVSRSDFSRADGLEKMLSAVIAERDLVARLNTWPWSATTFRGFASALLLPIILFVITRLIERLL